MAKTKARRIKAKRRRFIIIVTTIFLLLFGLAIGLGVYIFVKLREERFLSQMLSDKTPIALLKVNFENANGEPLADVVLGDELDESLVDCTKLNGQANSILSIYRRLPLRCRLDKRLKDAKQIERSVVSYSVGVSILLQRYQEVWKFIDENPRARELIRSKVVQDSLSEISKALDVRGIDSGLTYLPGKLLWPFVFDAFNSDAKLHYDTYRGSKGFVFSCDKDLPVVTRSLLEIVIGAVARKVFVVDGLDEPVVELRIGGQMVYVSEHKGRYYLANSLEALFNVIASCVDDEDPSVSGSLIVIVRPQTHVGTLLPALFGNGDVNFQLAFDFKQKSSYGIIPTGGFGKRLQPKIFRGVFAAIPQNAFTGIVASAYIPASWGINKWGQISELEMRSLGSFSKEAGVGIIWDVEARDDGLPSDVGIIIAHTNPRDVPIKFRELVSNPDLTYECAGGTVLLASTSQAFLQKMKASCEKQAPSALEWPGKFQQALSDMQVLFFVNPGKALKAAFERGFLLKEEVYSPEATGYGAESYKKATDFAQEEAFKTFSKIPTFIFSGETTGLFAERAELDGYLAEEDATGAKK